MACRSAKNVGAWVASSYIHTRLAAHSDAARDRHDALSQMGTGPSRLVRCRRS